MENGARAPSTRPGQIHDRVCLSGLEDNPAHAAAQFPARRRPQVWLDRFVGELKRKVFSSTQSAERGWGKPSCSLRGGAFTGRRYGRCRGGVRLPAARWFFKFGCPSGPMTTLGLEALPSDFFHAQPVGLEFKIDAGGGSNASHFHELAGQGEIQTVPRLFTPTSPVNFNERRALSYLARTSHGHVYSPGRW